MQGPQSSNEPPERYSGSEASEPPVSALEPAPTRTLIGRLFVVPALVVCLMLGVAVVVVLFGASSMDKPATVDELISMLEADSGDRQLGMLLPSAKEAWQAAQELAQRFENKDKFFDDSRQIENAAARLIALLNNNHTNRPAPTSEQEIEKGRLRRHFLMMALSRLETPSVVPPLVALLSDPFPETRRIALQSLASMRSVKSARDALPSIFPLLQDQDVPVRMVACLTIAALAEPGHSEAVTRVAALLDDDREVQWNAASALARMGSARGKPVLLNMLDRAYWEHLQLDYVEDGTQVQRKLTESEVIRRICSAISSVRLIEDPDVRTRIRMLKESDSSPDVREAARRAFEDREHGGGTSAAGGSIVASSGGGAS